MRRSGAALKKAKQSAGQTWESARETVDYGAEAARAGVREVGEEVRERRDQVRETAQELRATVKQDLNRASDHLRGTLAAGRDSVASVAENCEDYVAEHPKKSVFGALGLGALFGALFGWRRGRRNT